MIKKSVCAHRSSALVPLTYARKQGNAPSQPQPAFQTPLQQSQSRTARSSSHPASARSRRPTCSGATRQPRARSREAQEAHPARALNTKPALTTVRKANLRTSERRSQSAGWLRTQICPPCRELAEQTPTGRRAHPFALRSTPAGTTLSRPLTGSANAEKTLAAWFAEGVAGVSCRFAKHRDRKRTFLHSAGSATGSGLLFPPKPIFKAGGR